jgi:flagellar biosynthesis protein FlhA
MGPDGQMIVISLSHSLERRLAEALQQSDQGEYLAVDPHLAQKTMQRLALKLEKFGALNTQPVVLCSARLRVHFKRLVDRFIPNLVVLSYDEIESNIRIQSIGVVELADED